ncbi:MAG: helix-turn-helix transcriptional regulator [Chloroflexi bacterium]|nr:helix-turn-helix transcriptional regulator [Chloroflexota bacterium]
MVYRSIGMRIQQARQELGLTQEELAAKLGCTQAALSNYELGKRRLYLASLEQIANILGKPLSYFLESLASPDEDDSQNWYSRYPYR